MAVMRASGTYAVVDGQSWALELQARDYVVLKTPTGPRRIERDDLEDLVKVVTTATWRGGTIVVSALTANEVGFYTSDRRLAAAEDLLGDQYGGWTGVASIKELSDVEERVSSVLPGEGA